jgi:adenosyl cobinamide kinase/adenosyl cobinamide phosphate guanylyltransferase
MADSIPCSQDKKRLKKCNFSREEIVLIQREVGKKIYPHKFKALKYKHK